MKIKQKLLPLNIAKQESEVKYKNEKLRQWSSIEQVSVYMIRTNSKESTPPDFRHMIPIVQQALEIGTCMQDSLWGGLKVAHSQLSSKV